MRPREQPVVVEVAVRDNDPEQRRVISAREAAHGRQRHVIAVIGGERPAEVEQEPGAVGLELDAGASDLARSAVDADPRRLELPQPALLA